MSAPSEKRLRLFLGRFLAALALSCALIPLASCAADVEQAADPAAAQNVEPAPEDTGNVAAAPTTGLPAVKIDERQEASGADGVSGSAETQPDAPPASAQDLVVRFVDVGQGDCILITCGEASLLIDGGPAGSSSKIYSILRDLGIARLDAVIATHPDADHCAGIAGALRFAPCDAFYCSTDASDTETFNGLAALLEEQNTAITVPACGDSFALGSALCTFIGPPRPMLSDNDNSLVLRLEHGATSFHFAADIEAEAEQALVASGGLQPADVLKVAHHGSLSSSSPSFLKTVKPRYAVLSVGENGYGHPSPVVLDRLAALPCEVLRTDEAGTIVIRSDGETLSFETVKGALHE